MPFKSDKIMVTWKNVLGDVTKVVAKSWWHGIDLGINHGNVNNRSDMFYLILFAILDDQVRVFILFISYDSPVHMEGNYENGYWAHSYIYGDMHVDPAPFQIFSSPLDQKMKCPKYSKTWKNVIGALKKWVNSEIFRPPLGDVQNFSPTPSDNQCGLVIVCISTKWLRAVPLSKVWEGRAAWSKSKVGGSNFKW